METDLAFRVNFADMEYESGSCRIVVTTGDVQVRSYSQRFSDHFRDLLANRQFLNDRVLASFFSGEEPLMNLGYANDSVVTAYVFKQGREGCEKHLGEFLIDEAISHIDEALDELSATSRISDNDKEALFKQVARDVALGVYDVYLKDQNKLR